MAPRCSLIRGEKGDAATKSIVAAIVFIPKPAGGCKPHFEVAAESAKPKYLLAPTRFDVLELANAKMAQFAPITGVFDAAKG